ncbi:MAG: VanZ family protein [Flavobacteriaceae bacterium]
MIKLIKSLWGSKILLVSAFLYTAAITIGSLISSEDIPKLEVAISDKLIHFVAYGFLVFICFLYSFVTFKHVSYLKNLLIVALFSFIYGIIIEALQGVVVLSREADFQDIIANFAGISFAVLILVLIRKKILNLKSIN